MQIEQRRLSVAGCLVVTILVACAAIASAAAADRPAAPRIDIEDVELFFKVYDAAGGRPTADQLQRDYLDAGSEGLHVLARVRNVTGTRIAETLAKTPEIYSNARQCMAVLPRVRQRVEVALRKLGQLYPQARFPPVTIAVGRGKPVGVGSPADGIQIGLEALCATHYMNPDVEDRFVQVIAHEYVHVQQSPALIAREPTATVLELSLIEGVAEFVAEMIYDKAAYSRHTASIQGREKEIETAFVPDMDKKDHSAWLYNGTTEKSGDLGYWVGYRITKSYYQHAADKSQAMREIIDMTDPKAFFARSGWYPGIQLQ